MIRIDIPSSANGSQIIYTSKRWYFLNNSNFYLVLFEFILAFYCVLCDYLIFKSNKLRQHISNLSGIDLRIITVLMDNASHAFIALMSWFIIRIPKVPVKELLLSAFIGSIIDIDHFLSAKSFSFDSALSLHSRPFMHNTFTLLIITLGISVIIMRYAYKYRYMIALVFISWFSHHLRDANRHGLWFGYDYKTPPLSSELYISLT